MKDENYKRRERWIVEKAFRASWLSYDSMSVDQRCDDIHWSNRMKMDMRSTYHLCFSGS